MSRYDGKPLRRLLECYVLWAIDALESKDRANLAKLEPKLHEIYQRDGTWQEVIASVMEFPEKMPELVKTSWTRNSLIGTTSGTPLGPEEFARMFVDENLTK